jgi:hypothetical protein
VKSTGSIITQENDSMYRVNLLNYNRYYNLENWQKYKLTVQFVLEKLKRSEMLLVWPKEIPI